MACSSGLLAELPFDHLIIGEGEAPFAALCAHLAGAAAITDIPGIMTRNMKAPRRTSPNRGNFRLPG